MEEKKNIKYKFKATKRESNVIEKRFADAQVKSMSAFFRMLLVNRIYLVFGINEIQSM